MRSLVNAVVHLATSAGGLAALVVLAAGCGTSPTAPRGAPHVESDSMEVTVTFQSILVVADGDGIEGAGDFRFSMRASKNGDDLYYATGDLVHLNTGETLTLNKTKIYRFRHPTDDMIALVAVASEIDQDIFGNTYPDSDLSGKDAVIYLPYDERRYNVGVLRPRLGNANCMVEFRISVTSRVVE